MARLEPWEAFERDVQQRLGLSATLSSGNKFFDSGDAVDNRHPSQSSYPMWVECKWTQSKSKTVKRDEVDGWRQRAEMLGKRFVLAVRFFDPRHPRLCADYAMVPMDDFEELLMLAGVRERTS